MPEFPVSFVILTDGTVDPRINEIVDSIEGQKIPEYEVLVVGGTSTTLHRPHLRHVGWHESDRPWITRKKNDATIFANHEVVVYLHDYHVFDSEWYSAMVDFGLDWDIQMNQVRMQTGHRMFDWLTIDYPRLPSHFALPYERSDITQNQYIPGGYWICKRNVMLETPQNESLRHFECEDLEWSRRVLPKYRYVMNPEAIVRHNKRHRECDWVEAREAEHAKFTGWE